MWQKVQICDYHKGGKNRGIPRKHRILGVKGMYYRKDENQVSIEEFFMPFGGKLILDATAAPADIKYPTDIDLLNKSREHLETAVGILWEKGDVPHTGHKLPYSAW